MLQSPDVVRRRRLVRAYGRVLHLYPRTFRAEFGAPMTVAFERWLEDEAARRGTLGVVHVCRKTLAELVPTLLREHVDALRERGVAAVAARGVRVLAACAAPVIAFAAMRPLAARAADQAVLAAWFLLMTAGMAWARGRGWACNRNAMLAAAAGVGVPLCWEAATRSTTPNVLLVAPLLIAAAATIGLILSTFVRVAVEGLIVSRPALND